MEMNGVTFTVPQRGDKKHLLELSLLNVKQYKVDRLKQAEKLNPEQRSARLMKEIQTQLGLDRLPVHIECFDNSNIQGSDAVAACVVFRKPTQQERIPEIQHQDCDGAGRLCIHAGSGPPPVHAYSGRTGRAS